MTDLRNDDEPIDAFVAHRIGVVLQDLKRRGHPTDPIASAIERELSNVDLDGQFRAGYGAVSQTPFLTDRLALLLHQGTKSAGTYQFPAAIASVEEQMTQEEFELAGDFLGWVVLKNRTFGHNLPTVFAEYVAWKKETNAAAR